MIKDSKNGIFKPKIDLNSNPMIFFGVILIGLGLVILLGSFAFLLELLQSQLYLQAVSIFLCSLLFCIVGIILILYQTQSYIIINKNFIQFKSLLPTSPLLWKDIKKITFKYHINKDSKQRMDLFAISVLPKNQPEQRFSMIRFDETQLKTIVQRIRELSKDHKKIKMEEEEVIYSSGVDVYDPTYDMTVSDMIEDN